MSVNILWTDARLVQATSSFDVHHDLRSDSSNSSFINLELEFLEKIWKPDVFFYNVIDSKIMEVLDDTPIIRVYVSVC